MTLEQLKGIPFGKPIIQEQTKISVGKRITEWTDEIMHCYHFVTFEDTHEIYYWNDGAYIEGGEVRIKTWCELAIENVKRDDVNEVIAAVKRRTYKKRSVFDNDSNCVSFSNGIKCRKCNAFFEHYPENLILTKLSVKYDEKAKCPNINRFLTQCLPNGKDHFSVLEHASSLLIPNLKLEKAFMYIGEGANGKSTWGDVLIKALGMENICSISLNDLEFNRFTVAKLYGKIANFYQEIRREAITTMEKSKQAISGDVIEGEKKGKDRFNFRPKARHFFSTNRLPEVEDETDAIFRRFDLIEWTQQFRTEINEELDLESGIYHADIKLIDKLTTDEELSGLFNLLLKIADKLEKRGRFLFAKSIEEMKRAWLEKSDSVVMFGKACLVEDSNWVLKKSDLLINYYKWCKREKQIPEPEKNFYRKLALNYKVKFDRTSKYSVDKRTKEQIVEGIKFNDKEKLQNLGHSITPEIQIQTMKPLGEFTE